MFCVKKKSKKNIRVEKKVLLSLDKNPRERESKKKMRGKERKNVCVIKKSLAFIKTKTKKNYFCINQ